MKQHLQQLINYEYWANNIVFNLVKNNPIKNERIIIILYHIFGAQRLWLARLQKEEFNARFFEPAPIEEIEHLKDESYNAWKEFIGNKKEHDLNALHDYRNLKGEPFSSKLTDIITHVTNHSEHHRAEIITLLKVEIPTINIPPTDYIFYTRIL
jgi:uncharacterized damage-inducible protein DinB